MERSFTFMRPVFTDRSYTMNLKLLSVDTDNHTATLKLSVKDENGKICISGRKVVKNNQVIVIENYPNRD